MGDQAIINRVAQSPLITLNLEDYFPSGERVIYDLKDNLFQGMILKEKDFRNFLKENDWSFYENKNVAILCSVDAIVPTWAFMLLTTKLVPFANLVVHGNLDQLEMALYYLALDEIDFSIYQDKKIVVKGCGDLLIPDSVYVEICKRLLPYASSIMYGEPCSTVPVYKRPQAKLMTK